jgi:UDP-N-acetyl-D-mannosaminouronate:lipid I N-acetyl-D-mannosaminouronosyltransferase
MNLSYSRLNGLRTYVYDSRQELIDFAIDKKAILIAINAEKIIKSNDSFQELVNKNIGYPDGFGAVWALRKHGFKNVSRTPGCELWLDIIARYYQEKVIYLVGSKPAVIEKTVEKLHLEYPGINIANYRDGYIKTEKEKEDLMQDVIDKQPDIVFVALGSPKQEIFMIELLKKHPALYMGLGGSFDVYSDYVKRAPLFYRKMNLEWLYRLLKQPTRIGRQLHLIRFAFLNIIGRI